MAQAVAGFDLAAREAVLEREILSGNVPEFWRQFVPLTVQAGPDILIMQVSPDYLAVGREADFFQTPLTPGTAWRIADRLDCVLPTRKMVDLIHAAAPLKLPPTPRPPGPGMTTVADFLAYQETVHHQRLAALSGHPWGTLTAGHHKDLVSTPRVAGTSGKVAIYGWHRPDGTPVQPLYTGHADNWVDYSHGVRLVGKTVILNGRATTVEQILTDPGTARLLSDEPLPTTSSSPVPVRTEAAQAAAFGETLLTLEPEPGVRLVVNRPAAADPGRPVRLVVYALPNGNTIEQTMGHPAAPGGDGHPGIQQIAAQTRWLRVHQPEVTLVTAYVECAEKSWPAWCRNHAGSGKRIAAILDQLRQAVAAPSLQLVLTGHSGGGAFIFGYLDSQEEIPGDVERIAFLDSNYAYDAAKGHAAKLTAWLSGGTGRFLTVIAYHDSRALLNGKPFVSEKGGTWGRSHAMLEDLGETFPFSEQVEGPLHRHTARNGRLTFLLMANPEQAVLHTRLVERNGLLQALLSGTPESEQGYVFFGEPVYRSLIGEP